MARHDGEAGDVSERTDAERPDERPEPAPRGDTAPYPGALDERLLTPGAPLPPGAAMRIAPIAVDPSFGSAPSPRWAPDPTGRHQWRWWGGVAWTDHVADDGVAAEDPLEPG